MPSVLSRLRGLLPAGADSEAAFARFVGAPAQPRTSSLGYDAINPKNKRRAPTGRLMFEERELMEQQRRLLVSGARDVQRNFAIAAFAIRKHLDFVSSFSFHPRTKEEGLNAELEAAVEAWSEPGQFDASGRHSRQAFTRLLEGRRCVDGDVFCVKIAGGGLQAVEGDRVRNPLGQMDMIPDQLLEGVIPKGLIQGVQVDKTGRAIAYAVHQRTLWGGFEFERLVPAADVWQHGFFDRFDQVRGVSPIAASLNNYQDAYEGIDYALGKMKVSQLFGIVFYRDAVDAAGGPGSAALQSAADGEGNTLTGYKVDFGQGPPVLDLDPGDKVDMLESATPSSQFKEFMQTVIAVCLKSLDIPYSFFDEAYTNFFGSRSALILYQMSARDKQAALRRILRAWFRWRLSIAVARREIKLPSGMTADAVPFDFLSVGVPWWNPKDEIAADLQSVDGLLQTREEIRKERFGDDWYEMMRRRKKEDDFLREQGYDPSYSAVASVPGAPTLEQGGAAETDKQATDERDKMPGEKEAAGAKA